MSNAVTIWVVRVDDDLYVRSWKGDGGAWFRATQGRHHGHIEAGGIGKDVAFVTGAAFHAARDALGVALRTRC